MKEIDEASKNEVPVLPTISLNDFLKKHNLQLLKPIIFPMKECIPNGFKPIKNLGLCYQIFGTALDEKGKEVYKSAFLPIVDLELISISKPQKKE